MKKLGVIVAVLAMLCLAGCASSGKAAGGGGGDEAPPYTVDLSTLSAARNTTPLAKQWDDFIVTFNPPIDNAKYSRLTAKVKYFKADGEELNQGDGIVMVSLINDPDGDIRGPEMGSGPNTPLKEFNVGGSSGVVHKDRGGRIRNNNKPIQAINFQAANPVVAFIEIQEITFHNGNYESE